MRIAGRMVGLAALLFVPLTGAAAQGTPGRTPASDGAFRRAIALVNEGEGAAGRALLDSLVNAARPNSLELAEALYWRATAAPSAAEAEQDYKRVILDHPLSPRVPDALLRLAQLELARGDRENALRRLQRLDIEYPAYPARARTSYWLARAYLDQNDTQRGCAAVTEARLRAAQNDVELRNQIDFLALRCPAPGIASTEAPPTQVAGAQQPPAAAAGAPARSEPPATQAAGAQPTTDSVPTTAGTPTAPASRPPEASPPAAPTGSGSWSVQVAAFNTRAQATALAERLRGRGHQARVDGSAAPFRVRVGRYASRAAASSALQELKGKGIDGFVTNAGTR